MCSGDFVEIYTPKNLKISSKLTAEYTSNKNLKTVDAESSEKESEVRRKEGVEGERRGEEGGDDADIYWDAVVTCFFVDTAPVVIGRISCNVAMKFFFVMSCHIYYLISLFSAVQLYHVALCDFFV